jgi:methanesulfonate monooxygenase small subunit
MTISDDQIKNVIYKSCSVLDAEDFDAYMDLYTEEFDYKVTNYSREIRKEQEWMDVNRAELKGLLANVPQHSRLLGSFMRHATVYEIERNGADTANALTYVTIYYTTPEGATRVWAVGRYHDVIDVSGETPLIADRDMKLETREVGIGTHLPM